MTIQIGGIVIVLLEDCFFKDKQGEVVEIKDNEDGPVGVLFDRRDIGHYTSSREERIIHFEYNELRLEDDWNMENRARVLFGAMYHHLCALTHPFNSENYCMHEGCQLKVNRRILVNVWGTIFERDTCNKHGDNYHGKMVDIFPDKPNYKPIMLTEEAS